MAAATAAAAAAAEVTPTLAVCTRMIDAVYGRCAR